MNNNFNIARACTKEILEALFTGSKTFGELAKLVNVHTLQRRLREFVAEGIVCREVLEDRRVRYKLTLRGLDFASKIIAMEKSFSGDLKRLMGKWYDGFVKEWAAYWGKRDEILRKHKGKYVSICNGNVVAVSDDFLESALKAQGKCGLKSMFTVKVGEELKFVRIRSPKVGKQGA